YWQEMKTLNADSANRQRARDSLFKLIREHGLVREFPLITATLKAFSHGKIRITADKKVVNAAENPIKGYDLTDEINKQLERVNLI
ncbi:MAG: hypothetical protein Q8Q07_06385, partial [Dehalococcoidales bacterium]|nr:hypothetical protein [Dehalococcoidales bacterium]